MRRIIVILLLAMFVSSASAGIESLTKNSEFTEPDPTDDGTVDVPEWTFFKLNRINYWPDSNDPGYESAGVLQTGWKHWDSMWQKTDFQLEADTVYTLKASVKLDRTGNNGVFLVFGAIDSDGNGTGLATSDPLLAPDADNYHEYSYSIDTSEAGVSSHVGEYLRVDVRRYGTNWTRFDYVRLLPDRPIIVTQPQDNLADPNADFYIGVASESDPNYTWYLSDDDQIGSDTVVGDNSDTLTFTNVSSSLDGKYVYCVVDNSTTYTATSDMAQIVLPKLMGYWKLDNDLTDASGNGWTGNASSTNFVTTDGIDGGSYEFLEDPNYSINIPGSADPFNNFNVGLTVSAWVKMPEAGSTWSAIVSKNSANTNGWMLGVTASGEYPYFSVRNCSDIRSGRDSDNPVNIVDNQWHLLTGTYNPVTGESKLYIDAELNVESTSTDSPVLTDAEVRIGDQYAVDPQYPFKGLVDDVRIYNYPLTKYEVIDLYNEMAEPDKAVCVDPYAEQFDLTGPAGEPDCIVDFYDFAEISLHWLDCSTYPNCQ